MRHNSSTKSRPVQHPVGKVHHRSGFDKEQRESVTSHPTTKNAVNEKELKFPKTPKKNREQRREDSDKYPPSKPFEKTSSPELDYFTYNIDPNIAVYVSSSATSSAASTPDTTNRVFDTSADAFTRGLFKSDATPLTPLTPPQKITRSRERSPSPLVSKSRRSRHAKRDSVLEDQSSSSNGVNNYEFNDKKTFRRKDSDRTFLKKLEASVKTASVEQVEEVTIKGGKELITKEDEKPIIKEEEEEQTQSEIIMDASGIAKDLVRDLYHTLPLNVHTRRKQSWQCIASPVKNSEGRCSSTIKNHSMKVEQTFLDIWEFDPEALKELLPESITALTKLVMCDKHQGTTQRRIAEFQELHDLAFSPCPTKIQKRKGEFILKWLAAFCNPNLANSAVTYIGTDLIAGQQPTPLEVPEETTSSKNLEFETSTGGYKEYQPAWSKDLLAPEALTCWIAKPLNDTEKKHGCVYVFWDREEPEFKKIGTAEVFKKRSWRKGCELRIPKEQRVGPNFEIPFASRIELLIHIELKEYRRKKRCQVCKQEHRESFQIDEADVLKVINKWVGWAKKEPYIWDNEAKVYRIDEDLLPEICKPVLSAKVSEALRYNTRNSKHLRRELSV